MRYSDSAAPSVFVQLDPAQQECVDRPLGPLAIIAGPGAGKTRTVVARIAALVARREVGENNVLALTHTTKAAGELKDRLALCGVHTAHVSTVHALALRQLRRFAPELGDTVGQLVSNSWPVVADAARGILAVHDGDAVSEVHTEIDWASSRNVGPSGYEQLANTVGRESNIDADKITEIWGRYEQLKQQRNIMDFADVLRGAATQLEHPGVAERVCAAFGALFVDEYQDIDPLQQHLVDAWLGGRDVLCVVGDPDQAIFGFKGADPTYLLTFSDRYPNAHTVLLTTNYRSSTEIVKWVNTVAVHKRQVLHSAAGSSQHPPRTAHYDTEQDEERALCEQLRTWRRNGLAWRDMAVLFRYNAIGARLEAALAAAGIPYATAGGVSFFERGDVKQVLRAFGIAARNEPDADGASLLDDAARANGWDPDDPPNGMGPARARHDAICALAELVADRYPAYDGGSLLRALQERARESHDVVVDAVTLASIHAAKGLEWPAVWLAGCTDGVMPSSYAKTKAQLDEERHLFYVAVSRAEQHLVVSAAQRRHNNQRTRPSPYLRLVGGEPPSRNQRSGSRRQQQGAVSKAATPPPRTCGCGNRLAGAIPMTAKACSGPCLRGDAGKVYDKLVAWRDGLDDPDVASDRALFAIAVRRSADNVVGLRIPGDTVPAELYR